MNHIEKELRLDYAGVDMASCEIKNYLTETGMNSQDVLRNQLTMEELLLRISQHFGGNISGTLLLKKRFGVPIIRFRYRAEAFNPTINQDDEIGTLTDRLLSNMGLSPAWSYRFGQNELVQRIPAQRLPSWLILLIALSIAILPGLVGMSLPMAVRLNITLFLFEPCNIIYERMISVFVGPIIFLSILNGICGMGSTADFGRLGKQMLTRFIGLNYISSAVMVMTYPFFARNSAGLMVGSGESQIVAIREMLLSFIPTNPITPFSEGNALQLVFLAAFLGIIMLNIKEKSARVLDLMTDLYDILMLAVSIICKLLPLYVVSSITLQIWSNGALAFTSLWKMIVLAIVVWSVYLIIKVMVVHFRYHVKLSVLFRKIFPAMVVGFATASSAIAYRHCININENKLGIPTELSRIGQIIGGILYDPCLSALFVLAIYNVAETYGAFGGLGWIFTIWLLCPIISSTVPPVTGGMLISARIIFAQLGLPNESLATSGVLFFMLDFVCTGFSLGMRHLELVLQAGKLGILDTEILRKEV